MAGASTLKAGRPSGAAFGAVLGAVAALYFADEVFLPLALAALFSFLLAPVAHWLERHGFNRAMAVLATAAAAFSLLAALFLVVANQFLGFARDLPLYKDNLVEKIRPLHSPVAGKLDETAETIKELKEELDSKKPAPRIPKVEVVQPPPGPVELVRTLLEPVMKPLGVGGIVMVFVIFMLLERERWRDRLIRVTGSHDLHRTTHALDEAGRRISRYLLMQTLINGIQGALVAAGLAFIGVPNAILWGALTVVLRFIPYLGPWIAALMPIALSFAVFDGWERPLATVALFVTLELLSNNVLEPWLYGHETGVSPLALLVAAVFWTWLWGPAGLLLAIPLTVSIVVLGKHVPQLAFLSMLLGDQPVLAPHERFYQRLLAGEPEEAEEVLEEAARERPAAEVMDSLIVPAIVFVQLDHRRGAIAGEERTYLLGQIEEAAEPLLADAGPGQTPQVVCLPAADEADGLAARLLGRLLVAAGVAAEARPSTAFKGELLDAVARLSPACVVVAAMPPGATAHASYLCRLLRGRFPDLPVMAGVWGQGEGRASSEARLRAAGAERVVADMRKAIEEVGRLVRPAHRVPLAVKGGTGS